MIWYSWLTLGFVIGYIIGVAVEGMNKRDSYKRGYRDGIGERVTMLRAEALARANRAECGKIDDIWNHLNETDGSEESIEVEHRCGEKRTSVEVATFGEIEVKDCYAEDRSERGLGWFWHGNPRSPSEDGWKTWRFPIFEDKEESEKEDAGPDAPQTK